MVVVVLDKAGERRLGIDEAGEALSVEHLGYSAHVRVIGDWWNALQGWYVWQWPGWVALGAIGTVGALFALYLQTHRLGQQLKLERRARQDDERVRREATQRASTPYLSMEAMPGQSVELGQSLYVFGLLHADGTGVVHNVTCNILRTTPPEGHMNTAEPIRYMRGDDDGQRIVFALHPSNVPQLLAGSLDVKIDVVFLNQFDQQVQFTQQGRVEATAMRDNVVQTARFTVVDAPKYKWPWDETATPPSPKPKRRSLFF